MPSTCTTGSPGHCARAGRPASPDRFPVLIAEGHAEGLSRMYGSRFIFLSAAVSADSGENGGERVSWMLVSSNNRPVGRSADQFHGYPACRTAALFLRA